MESAPNRLPANDSCLVCVFTTKQEVPMQTNGNHPYQLLFSEHKKQLHKLAEQLGTFAKDPAQVDWLKKINDNLKEEKFRLVVLGQFKRGKSTFINALLGEAILPTDVIPLTAVITEISYNPKIKAEVIFQDGHRESIRPDQLAAFVSESQNPTNQKHVDKVILQHPAKILQDGLILVDTPGVGSIHQHNTRLTQEYIPNVDAAIFLFSADPPLTELEQEFLKIIQPIVPKIFFVLNKMDYLEADSLQRVLDFNRRILKDLLGETQEIEIAPISALNALKAQMNHSAEQYARSGLKELEHNLQHFLVVNRGKLIILSNAERIERLCSEQKNLIEMERRAQASSVETLQNNLQKFEAYIAKMQRHEQRLTFLLDGLKSHLIEYFDTETGKFQQVAREKILQDVLQFIAQNRSLSIPELQKQCENKINNEIVDQFEPFRMGIEKAIKERYADEIETINDEVIEIINQIYRYSAQLFELDQTTALPKEIWRFKSQFYYRTWEVVTSLDILEKGLLGLLPKPLFLSLFKRKLPKVIQEKLDRQCGRLRADFLYRLQDSNRQYLFEFNEAVQKIHRNITGMMQNYLEIKKKGESDFSALVREQEKKQKALDAILDEIARIKQAWNSAPQAALKQD